MRIAFIAPYDEFALGIRSISSFLKARGHAVSRIFLKMVFELWRWPEVAVSEGAADVGPRGFFAHPCRVTTREADLLIEKLADLRVQLVGISLSSNITNLGEFLTRRIHQDLGVPVVWGGIDPTLHPDKAVEVADFVCEGEGEYAMADLAAALETGQRAPEVAGVWTRKPDGTVYRGPIRPLIADLDALPYCDWDVSSEFSLFADEMSDGFVTPAHTRVHLQVPILTQRGCPYECTYCCYSLLKKRYPGQKFVRRRSVGNVLGEMAQLRQRFPTIEAFFFHDDVFTIDPAWIEQFAERYSREVALPFIVFTHPSSCARRTVEPLKKAGLLEARIGIQSGSERILYECYNRRTSREQILKSAQLIHDLGLGLVVDLIGYNPMETEEDLRATLDILLRLPRPFRISLVNPLCFYEGLPITEKALAAGVSLTRPVGGGNKFEQVVTPYMRFWAALMGLTMFDFDPQKVILPLADDPYLREHPEILENLRLALFQMNFLDGQTAEMPKDACIADLRRQLGAWHERARRPLLRKVLDRLLRR
jgi:radical SAM superfamily enzyme YgiQ (UPF0313 family)